MNKIKDFINTKQKVYLLIKKQDENGKMVKYIIEDVMFGWFCRHKTLDLNLSNLESIATFKGKTGFYIDKNSYYVTLLCRNLFSKDIIKDRDDMFEQLAYRKAVKLETATIRLYLAGGDYQGFAKKHFSPIYCALICSKLEKYKPELFNFKYGENTLNEQEK